MLKPGGFLNQIGRKALLPIVVTFLTAWEGSHYTWAANQGKQVNNPLAGQAAAINEGQSIFRGRCAMCHGTDAGGGLRGPSLTAGRLTHGDSDAALLQVITQGVPGTQMSGSGLPEQQAWKVIAYLRSLAAHATISALGNRTRGEELFFEKIRCSQCHMVNGRGGRLGPELSRIGVSRSIGYLKEKIREPNKLGEGMTIGLWWELGQPLVYQTVTLITKDDRRITGVLRNEDTFSIQIMDQSEELRMFSKKDLKQVIHERGSLMPGYDEQTLNEKELQDLLAYLDSLR